MNNTKIFLALSLIFAFALTFLSSPGAAGNLKFHLFGMSENDRQELEKTVNVFNQHFAAFYDTGGSLAWLDEFPGANLVKRRIFQDINNWKKNGLWFMHDLQKAEFDRIEMFSSTQAVVETREIWEMWTRKIEDGKKSRAKRNPVKVRYYISKYPGRWVVVEYEVFGMEDEMGGVKGIR